LCGEEMKCRDRYDFKTLGFTTLDEPIKLCTTGDRSCPSYIPFLNGGVKLFCDHNCYGYCGEKE